MGKEKKQPKDLKEELDDDIINFDDEIIDDISISDEDVDKVDESSDIDNFSLSKHQIEGKHSLKYDTIFKGKKEEINEDEEMSFTEINYETIELDKSSSYYSETNDNENRTQDIGNRTRNNARFEVVYTGLLRFV